MLYLSFESLLRHLRRFVQPGCTIKVFSVPPRYLDQFYCFAPAYFPELLLRGPASGSRVSPSGNRPSDVIRENALAGGLVKAEKFKTYTVADKPAKSEM